MMARLKSGYVPPFTITPEIVRLVSGISETLGGFSVTNPSELSPVLRRGNRLRPILAYLPVETVIKDRQEEYCHVLEKSDQQADSTAFVAFMLNAILDSLRETMKTDQDSDQVNDQVERLLHVKINLEFVQVLYYYR